MKMERISIQSSNLVSVGYDINEEILEIEFKKGSVYQYKDVPEFVYQDFMNSESKGKFFNQNIKDNYESERVEG